MVYHHSHNNFAINFIWIAINFQLELPNLLTLSLLAWGSATERELRLWNVMVGLTIIMTSAETLMTNFILIMTQMALMTTKIDTDGKIYTNIIVTQKWQWLLQKENNAKQDGSCLVTLLMPGGVAGFPALRLQLQDRHLVVRISGLRLLLAFFFTVAL